METSEALDVLIVGAGISGIGMAAHLAQRLPGKRYAILERRERIGGTWDLFRYPGVRSDSDMFTLGYEFEPWRDKRAIAPGEVIRDYLAGVADRRGITDHIRFGQTVNAANWDSAAGRWTVTMTDTAGRASTASAKFLFLGPGYYDYDDPHQAEIAGLADFGGITVHPQFWPQDLDYTEKKVVVVGSGATAVSLVPALAEQAAHVTMLQRTPTWLLIRPAHDGLANLLARILPAGWAHRLNRFKSAALQNMLVQRSRSHPEAVKEFLHGKLAEELGPDFDRADFTPPYDPWNQRLCLVPDGDLFAAMRAGTASIVTGAIAHADQAGVVLEDGRRLDADVIVTATGLRLAVLGKIAVSLDGEPVDFSERFYYRNCMFSNVPNLAALFGYLSAGWTLRVDLVADWLCRLWGQMDAWDVDVVTPFLPPEHDLVEDDVFGRFSSGYLQRARHLVPKSATEGPWRISMDYMADRAEMRDTPIDDGALRFARTPREQVFAAE
ncbi:MAG: NAD(P)/FAD-dependent oxidoreductase [Novosphingobium sp.]|nr:NAD(P)/FAD-dependent oxidoreductase [Novosphingobium sp.]